MVDEGIPASGRHAATSKVGSNTQDQGPLTLSTPAFANHGTWVPGLAKGPTHEETVAKASADPGPSGTSMSVPVLAWSESGTRRVQRALRVPRYCTPSLTQVLRPVGSGRLVQKLLGAAPYGCGLIHHLGCVHTPFMQVFWKPLWGGRRMSQTGLLGFPTDCFSALAQDHGAPFPPI